ncbi:GNAT family N-acetyltransferase [Mameliella sp. AT18]|uniref:GNAT family N-acetyltransferase n=1 Tax=Mameliella TaxID=1434019 RepID=UPI0008410A1E|nr:MULTISPECIES: GNAT family N-acetyltransferase [Mameliella]MCR9276036.1 GNAT family N-acetyltransferase [Paracoccaceae bacterium]MDD9728322.1 GNAT family N-acetyltransferase [Mameliella sp. AT18]ODM47383.1 acetyltransferase [Ruegeria sp. PBVC088]OWV56851.1 GNAT family N-acetyltransferase [Mameliella alba]
MKNETCVIRPFDMATDIESLSAIWFDASLAAHSFLGRARLLEQRKLIEDLYLPSSETWVACRQETPVGFISLLDRFIGGLFVSPGYHGRGIGRRLVDRALTLKGSLSLDVYTRNDQACAFYAALGFREMSRRPTDDQGLPFEIAHLQLNP